MSPFHFSDSGLEVDYEPDSGMDTDELAEHHSPLQQPVLQGGVPHHVHTPPPWHHEWAGVLPAGADYDHLGLGYEVPEWYLQQQEPPPDWFLNPGPEDIAAMQEQLEDEAEWAADHGILQGLPGGPIPGAYAAMLYPNGASQ